MTTISLIIPTCQKPAYLVRTLASLRAQTDGDFQVVVVDDGGGTSEYVVKEWAGELTHVYVQQPNAGRAAARNAGIEAADSEILLFLDDDRIAHPDLVATHRRAQSESPGAAVIGWKRRCLTVWQRDALPLNEADHLLLRRTVPELCARMGTEDFALTQPEDLLHDLLEAMAPIDLGDDFDNYPHILRRYGEDLGAFRLPWVLGTTANMSVARDLVAEVGRFDDGYHGWGMEDTDFSYRLHALGTPFRVQPAAMSWHQVHPLGARPLAKELKERQRHLIRNLHRFCAVHPELDSYLYWRKWKGVFGLEAASDLLDAVDTADSGTLRAELVATYRVLLAADAALGGYEDV